MSQPMQPPSEREFHEFQQLLNVRDPRAIHVYSEYQRTNNDAYFHAAVRSVVSLPPEQPSTELPIQNGQMLPLDLQSMSSTSGGGGNLPMTQQMYPHPHHQMPPGYDMNVLNSHFQGLGMGKTLPYLLFAILFSSVSVECLHLYVHSLLSI